MPRPREPSLQVLLRVAQRLFERLDHGGLRIDEVDRLGIGAPVRAHLLDDRAHRFLDRDVTEIGADAGDRDDTLVL